MNHLYGAFFDRRIAHRRSILSVLAFTLGLFLAASVPQAEAQISNFPYSQSFESGSTYGPWGTWTQGPASSNPRWQRRSGSTGSSNTGPSGAHDGSWYIYLETSGGSTGSTDYVTGSFNFSSVTSPYISFFYHMYGSSMGTLAVEASLDNGTNWIEFWSKSGQQHNSSGANWTKDSVSLCALSGFNNVMLRFKGVRGSSYRSDMAIDLVKVYDGPLNPATYVSSTTTQDNTTATGTGLADQEIIGVEIDVTGDCPATPVTSFTFNTTGSTNASADITAAKLWFTGPSDQFATAVQFGSTIANPSGNFTFSGDTIG
ncbi:MAG: hypothetical protein KFH87_01950, partial [Bacteroidetes bacterium]|nr:hypothetical protein [Bacteroidota bacterium]